MANEKVIAGLQTLVTMLAQQADAHVVQSRVFASEGFSKLADKFAEHAEEEREFVQQFIDRLIDLGCDVRVEAKQEMAVYKDPVDYLKFDLETNRKGFSWLKDLVEAAREDYTTFDILKKYYQDEEEDSNWNEAQLELIECIGKQNWLFKQM